jgi:hypothetical protein
MSDLRKQTCKKQLPDYTASHPEDTTLEKKKKKRTSLRVHSASHKGNPPNFEFLGTENASRNEVSSGD